ncbi:hypothetical protein IAT40_005862 [Kwoniella sp. CBS 6097]
MSVNSQQLSGSRRLWGFPNTMGPMISVEALLALRLLPPTASISSKARVLGLSSNLSVYSSKSAAAHLNV